MDATHQTRSDLSFELQDMHRWARDRNSAKLIFLRGLGPTHHPTTNPNFMPRLPMLSTLEDKKTCRSATRPYVTFNDNHQQNPKTTTTTLVQAVPSLFLVPDDHMTALPGASISRDDRALTTLHLPALAITCTLFTAHSSMASDDRLHQKSVGRQLAKLKASWA